MRFTASWIALLQLASLELASAITPPVLRPRQYDTRDYYALKLSPDAVPQDVAGRLGLEFEGPLGQLDDHYLFSGPLGGGDIVSDYQRRRKTKRDAEGMDANDMILFTEKQRVKRLEKRTVSRRQSASKFGSKHDQNLVQELLEVAEALNIQDPIFHEQWHLFNSTVAIVDDGLDMYSEDLKANYVSRLFGTACTKLTFIVCRGFL
jgi:kexin